MKRWRRWGHKPLDQKETLETLLSTADEVVERVKAVRPKPYDLT